MKKIIFFLFFICTVHTLTGCRGSSVREEKIIEPSLVNTKNLDHLYTSITFSSGVNAAGIYIYNMADDKKIKAIYALVEDEIEQAELDYSNELKAELDKRFNDYKNGEKMIGAAAAKRQINKILNA